MPNSYKCIFNKIAASETRSLCVSVETRNEVFYYKTPVCTVSLLTESNFSFVSQLLVYLLVAVWLYGRHTMAWKE